MSPKEVEARIKELDNRGGLSTGQASAALSMSLTEGETIESAMWGKQDGKSALMVTTPQRAIVVRTKAFGCDIEDLEYPRITAVQHEGGIINGKIVLSASNVSIVLDKTLGILTQQFADGIRAKIAAGRSTPAPTAAKAASVADEIRSLAALRDDGILSEEEFAAKKRQLLGLE